MSNLEQGDRQAAAVQKTPNRVTLEAMKSRIASTETIHPMCEPTMTIVVARLDNGFVLVGKSAPADPANFNAELGQQFALEDCLRQMWPLEGYLLRERLAGGRLAGGGAI